MAKVASLDQFQVNKKDTPAKTTGDERQSRKKERGNKPHQYITKGFQVSPDAAQQFDILKAETGPNSGPTLIAEALNLLFKKHNKPTIA